MVDYSKWDALDVSDDEDAAANASIVGASSTSTTQGHPANLELETERPLPVKNASLHCSVLWSWLC